ncbi:MAG: hypothetical protein ACJAX5_000590 [Patiriisocius sp.]|jgi:hypothetical protein
MKLGEKSAELSRTIRRCESNRELAPVASTSLSKLLSLFN